MSQLDKKVARLEKVIFTSQDTGYCIGVFEDLESLKSFTAVGSLPSPVEGQTYYLFGSVTIHPRHGEQFKFNSAKLVEPANNKAIIKLLSSQRFKGVGKASASRLVSAFGTDTLDMILHHPEEILEQKLIHPDKLQVLQEGLKEFANKSAFSLKLLEMGLSQKTVEAMEEYYKTDLESSIKEDPFDAYYHLHQFDYKDLMTLLEGLKVPSDDIRRLEVCLYQTLVSYCINDGHTWIPVETLKWEFWNVDEKLMEECLDSLEYKNKIKRENNRLFPFYLYTQEWSIAQNIKKHTFPVDTPDDKELEELIDKFEKKESITYDPIQKEAIHAFFNHSIMILNGGPGTGKSTTVKGILYCIQQLYPNNEIQLLAPTGRAAKRLSALSSAQARTIHSYLGWDPEINRFKNTHQELEADFVIVDEFSMVDTSLFSALLKGISAHTRILLIGDEEQLESVNPGKVFNDLIASQTIPEISLKTLFRQKEGSGIAKLAYDIRAHEKLEFENGASFHSCYDNQIIPEIRKMVEESEDPQALQILAPMHNRDGGITAINTMMQELLNPLSPLKNQLVFDKVVLREGDKVMLTKNRAEDGVFNGDMGEIEAIDTASKVVEVNFDPESEEGHIVSFRENLSSELEHAWCVSVHKAQGSEYQQVIFACPSISRHMLKKRLLYTGISRAKKKLDVIGDYGAFVNGVQPSAVVLRNTALQERLEKFFFDKN